MTSPAASPSQRASGPRKSRRAEPIPFAAPRGFEPIAAFVLGSVRELPGDVYIRQGSHALLYATVGADAADLTARAGQGMSFLIREEDGDLFRRALSARLPSVLGDSRVPPLERSRTAYSIAAKVMAPIFTESKRVDREGLTVTHDAVDAVTLALTREEELIWTMVATMQKHLVTHTHAMNTAVYAVVLARFLKTAGPEEMQDVGRGALLHDIGKNRVPAAILDKPGPLDEHEWQVMRGHPRAGFEIVTSALGYSPSYAHIIAEHHERCDGSGYPQGRREYQVAMDSQLVAIVDAFDAITSARTYKAAASSFEALRIMRFRMRGQFRDDLMREFIGLLGGWRALRRQDLRELEVIRGVVGG